MGQEQLGRNVNVSRRAYLGAVGAVSASAGLVGVVDANEGRYDEVVNIVEEGADNSGGEPIDDVFAEHAADDTLIKFPPGTYVANQLIIYDLENFAMVGDDATLVPGDNYDKEVWLGGGETRDVRIENFTIDNSESGVAPQIDISAYDGLQIRNVTKVGLHDERYLPVSIQMLSADGEGLIEGFHATDGGYSVGMYLHGEGAFTVRNCRVEKFTNNGLYASNVSAPVTVEGGVFRNNNIAQVRLGSADSSVRDAVIGADEPVNVREDDEVNVRGIRIADGPGPVTIEDCDIHMEKCQGTGAIVNAYSGGSFTVRDTHIHVAENYTTTGSDGSRSSYGIFVDNANGVDPGSRTIEDVSITGGGTYRSAVLVRRSDNTIRNVCINQTGEGRDGIVFENSNDNAVVDSVIDVPDEEIVLKNSGAKKANNSHSGSCSASSSTATADAPGETGRVTREQTSADEWHTVEFNEQYEDPVVISKPLSAEGPHPCHVRLRDVTSGGYEFQLEEWQYLDGKHWAEAAHYLALKQGSGTAGDLQVEIGQVGANHTFSRIAFDQEFDRLPVVFAQSQTRNGDDPIVTRLKDVSTTGARVTVQEEESEENGGYHFQETVGYVAIEPGTGTLGGRAFEVANAGAGVDSSWHRIDFDGTYEDPRFLADIQTYNGPNTATLRYRNLTSSSVEVLVEEEQSADEETWHRNERVGYLVTEGA